MAEMYYTLTCGKQEAQRALMTHLNIVNTALISTEKGELHIINLISPIVMSLFRPVGTINKIKTKVVVIILYCHC